jgi:hypothetical protein
VIDRWPPEPGVVAFRDHTAWRSGRAWNQVIGGGLADRGGALFLYRSRDLRRWQVKAMTMGDRVAAMRAGVLQQVDQPQVLYDHPDNLFVAAFIGSPAMNLYEASLTEGARALRLGRRRSTCPTRSGPRIRAWPPTPASRWSSGCGPSTCRLPSTGRPGRPWPATWT